MNLKKILKIMVYFIIGLSFVILFFPVYKEGFDQPQYIKDNPNDFSSLPPSDGIKKCRVYSYQTGTYKNTCNALLRRDNKDYYPIDLAALKRNWKAVHKEKDEFNNKIGNGDTKVRSFINNIKSYNKSLQKDIPPILTQIDATSDQMHKFHTITMLKDTTSDIGILYNKLQDLKKWLNTIKHSNTIATNADLMPLPSSKDAGKIIYPILASLEIYSKNLTTTIYDEITNIITKISEFVNNASVVEDNVKEYIKICNNLITSLKKLQDSIQILKSKIDYTEIKTYYNDYSAYIKRANDAQEFDNKVIQPYKNPIYGRINLGH